MRENCACSASFVPGATVQSKSAKGANHHAMCEVQGASGAEQSSVCWSDGAVKTSAVTSRSSAGPMRIDFDRVPCSPGPGPGPGWPEGRRERPWRKERPFSAGTPMAGLPAGRSVTRGVSVTGRLADASPYTYVRPSLEPALPFK